MTLSEIAEYPPPGGIAKGLPLDDGDFCVRRTIVKAKGLGDATQSYLDHVERDHRGRAVNVDE